MVVSLPSGSVLVVTVTGVEPLPELADPVIGAELADPVIGPELADADPVMTPELADPETTPELSDPETTPELADPEATPELVDPDNKLELADSEATPELADPLIVPELADPEMTPELADPEATPELAEPVIATLELPDALPTAEELGMEEFDGSPLELLGGATEPGTELLVGKGTEVLLLLTLCEAEMLPVPKALEDATIELSEAGTLGALLLTGSTAEELETAMELGGGGMAPEEAALLDTGAEPARLLVPVVVLYVSDQSTPEQRSGLVPEGIMTTGTEDVPMTLEFWTIGIDEPAGTEAVYGGGAGAELTSTLVVMVDTIVDVVQYVCAGADDMVWL